MSNSVDSICKTFSELAAPSEPASATASEPAPSELVNEPARTLATSWFFKDSDNVETARKELYRLGIKTSYNENVVICSLLNGAKHTIDNEYAQECNGLILNSDTWEPLVVPCRSLRPTINTDVANTFLHQGLYHIYEALDGTTVNLYYFGSRWVISTNKGHTMNDVKWERLTYTEIISDCLKAVGIDGFDALCDMLDRDSCYTLGFKHPSFHKFHSQVSDIWFVQSTVVNSRLERYLWSSDQSPSPLLKSQPKYTASVSNMRDLYKKAGGALDDYIRTGNVCYGFILRSVNQDATTYHSDLYVESSLMRAIRKCWYDCPAIQISNNMNWQKERAVVIYNYLDRNADFLKLFPQYQAEFTRLEEFTKSTCNAVTAYIHKPSECSNLTKQIADLITVDIKIDTTATHHTTYNLVYNFTRHVESLTIYYMENM